MHARATAASAVLLAVLISGCVGSDRAGPDRAGSDGAGAASAGPVAAPRRSGPAAPAVHDRWESCAKAVPTLADDPFGALGRAALTLPLLDGGFEPVAALICRTDLRERPDGSSETTVEEVRADDLTAVLPALRLPDGAPEAELCSTELLGVPWLALLDSDGRWIRPGVPVDTCGKPRPEFRKAYAQLATTLVESRVVRRL